MPYTFRLFCFRNQSVKDIKKYRYAPKKIDFTLFDNHLLAIYDVDALVGYIVHLSTQKVVKISTF